MQAGFAFLEAGTVRGKNVTNSLFRNLICSCTYYSGEGYYITPYCIEFSKFSFRLHRLLGVRLRTGVRRRQYCLRGLQQLGLPRSAPGKVSRTALPHICTVCSSGLSTMPTCLHTVDMLSGSSNSHLRRPPLPYSPVRSPIEVEFVGPTVTSTSFLHRRHRRKGWHLVVFYLLRHCWRWWIVHTRQIIFISSLYMPSYPQDSSTLWLHIGPGRPTVGCWICRSALTPVDFRFDTDTVHNGC